VEQPHQQMTADTVVKRDGSGNFAAGIITADLTGDVTGNADTATTLELLVQLNLLEMLQSSVSFNGSQNVHNFNNPRWFFCNRCRSCYR
jgi:hypothetical protein